MVKTFEIDLDDALVENASEIFEALGTDIDTAIKMFLTQATLRQGFPFEVVIPNEEAESTPAEPELDSLHEGVSEEEENALATAMESASVEESAPVPPISAEVAARVAANEALVAEMREEIGDKAVTPEFDENEDDGTHGDYDTSAAPSEEDEEEDETTPDNLFDAWDVGEEEGIGCC